MKREIFLLIMCLYAILPLASQEAIDQEMQRLINHVSSLRQIDQTRKKAAWEQVSDALANDKAWTIMDEIVPDTRNECRLTDRTVNWFSLNRMLSQQMGYLETQVRGEFNNGEDPNFSYSLIERSVKAGAMVSYDLKSREGKQFFVIMPFDEDAAKKFEVKVSCNGEEWIECGTVRDDGNVYLVIPESRKLKAQNVLTLSVKNASGKNMAFVILNHNTRRK